MDYVEYDLTARWRRYRSFAAVLPEDERRNWNSLVANWRALA